MDAVAQRIKIRCLHHARLQGHEFKSLSWHGGVGQILLHHRLFTFVNNKRCNGYFVIGSDGYCRELDLRSACLVDALLGAEKDACLNRSAKDVIVKSAETVLGQF